MKNESNFENVPLNDTENPLEKALERINNGLQALDPENLTDYQRRYQTTIAFVEFGKELDKNLKQAESDIGFASLKEEEEQIELEKLQELARKATAIIQFVAAEEQTTISLIGEAYQRLESINKQSIDISKKYREVTLEDRARHTVYAPLTYSPKKQKDAKERAQLLKSAVDTYKEEIKEMTVEQLLKHENKGWRLALVNQH